MNSHITKPLSITGLVCLSFVLLALLAQPVDLEARMSFFVKVGAGYGGQSQDYNTSSTFSYFAENGTLAGTYVLDTAGMLLETGLGLYFTPNIGLEILFDPGLFGKSGTATFSAQVPHPFHFNQFRTATWSATDMKYSAMELDLNLLGRFMLLRGKLGIYASAGLAYFPSVKVTSLSEVSWTGEAYPYTSVTASPVYAEFSKAVFGFGVGGGVEYFIFGGLGVYISARYVIASGTLAIGGGTQIDVKPGGIRLSGGIKYAI
jgi:hypothetical protein